MTFVASLVSFFPILKSSRASFSAILNALVKLIVAADPVPTYT